MVEDTSLLLPFCDGLGVEGGDGESRDITDDEGSSLTFERVTAPALLQKEAKAEDEDGVGLLELLFARLFVCFLFDEASSSESLKVKSTVSPEVVVEVGSLVDITEVCAKMLCFGGSVVITSKSSEITSTFCTGLPAESPIVSLCFTCVLHEPSLWSCISVSSPESCVDTSTS